MTINEDVKCETCKHWKVLNQHHIKNGQPVKSCDSGEHPDSCRDYEEKIIRRN